MSDDATPASEGKRISGDASGLDEMALLAEPRPSGPAAAWQRYGGWAFGAMALIALIVVVLHLGDLERFTVLLTEVRPDWLLLAALAQGATYVCAAGIWHRILQRAGHARPLRSLIPLGLAKVFTDQAVPSGGFSGALLVVRGLHRRGVPSQIIASIFLIGFSTYYVAYLLAALISLASLWVHHNIGPAVLMAAGALSAFIAVALLSVILLRRHGADRLPSWLRRLPVLGSFIEILAEAPGTFLHDRRLLAEVLVLQFAVFLLDASTLWLLFEALEHPVAFWIAFVSFVIASVVATIGPIPLGLGTFEAGSVAMLSASGVPVETALMATLLLRGFTFWLPMIPGLWLARHEVGRPCQGSRATSAVDHRRGE